jgi:hypothetical protein
MMSAEPCYCNFFMNALSNELGTFMMWIVNGKFARFLSTFMMWLVKEDVGVFSAIRICNEKCKCRQHKLAEWLHNSLRPSI